MVWSKCGPPRPAVPFPLWKLSTNPLCFGGRMLRAHISKQLYWILGTRGVAYTERPLVRCQLWARTNASVAQISNLTHFMHRVRVITVLRRRKNICVTCFYSLGVSGIRGVMVFGRKLTSCACFVCVVHVSLTTKNMKRLVFTGADRGGRRRGCASGSCSPQKCRSNWHVRDRLLGVRGEHFLRFHSA